MTLTDEIDHVRKRLPNRRAFADGGGGEIFISNHKAGSHLNACVRDLGIVASLALQFGCSPDTLRNALLRNADGSPATALGAALDIISGRAR